MAVEVIAIPRRPRVEFDQYPPGPALSAALDDVDITALTGQDVAAGARAGFRAANHLAWQRLTYLREMCCARADTTDRDPDPDPAIAAAAFGWSMAMASAQLTLALGALDRLPAVGEAMWDGRLEERKATVFVTVLADLDDDQAGTVVADVLPDAPALPVQRLAERVTRAAIAADDLWAARRYAAARRRARVSTAITPAGTADLAVRDASPELVQDAYLHLQTLARTVRARLRAAGRRVRLGYITAHLLLRLLDGTLIGHDDPAVLDAVTDELLNEPDTPDDDTPDNDPPDNDPPDGDGPGDGGAQDWPSGGGPEDGPSNIGPDDDGPADDGPNDEGQDDECPGDGSPVDSRSDGAPSDGAPSDGAPSDGAPSDGAPSDGAPSDGAPSDGAPVGDDLEDRPHERGPRAAPDPQATRGPAPVPASGQGQRVALLPGVTLRLTLATRLGLAQHPAELPGLAAIPGHLAKAIARRRNGSRTALLLHDPAGHLEYLLDLGPPPAATTNPRRRQILEITADTDLLDLLDPADYDDDRAELIRRAHHALDTARAHPQNHPAVTLADRDRRHPGAALARWVRARDQTCPFRACTRRAHDNDLDHTLARAEHGPTIAANLSPPCRAHHTRKHATWRLAQPAPGRFVITDPTGTEHHTESRVVDPLPEPCPPVEEEPHRITPEQQLPTPQEPTEPWRPRRTRDGRITPEAREAAAHLVDRARHLHPEPPSRYDHDPDF